jgi:glycosyltransferase involved in cell wall biosynthesis
VINFSIIVVSYNSEKSINESLFSIFNQSYNYYQIISIDGLSRDNTVLILKNLLLPSNFHISEKDNGIYDALNKGIIYSKGDIIGILHSDDVYVSTYILNQVSDCFIKTNCDGVYGNLNFINNGKIVRKWQSRKFVPSLLNNGWMPPHPTLFLRKEVFEKHGLYDTNFKIAADYDFILRIFKDESLKFEYLPITITNMSIGGVSTSGFRNLIRKSFEDYKVLKNNNMKYPLLILFRKIAGKISQFYAI